MDVSAPSEVQGPLRRGAVLGRATVLVGGRRAATVALRAARDVPAASVVDRVRTLVDSEKIPIAIAVCVILIGAVITSRLLR